MADTHHVKDHVVRDVVNRLRDTALEFHAHGSLRERLARELEPLLVASRPAEVDDEGLPAALFDGHAVYSEITRKLGKAHCHSHETVSATLDAVVRLMRTAPAEHAQ
jgi:hypothetical protein